MKIKFTLALAAFASLFASAFAQKKPPALPRVAEPVIFAVLNGGTTLEPIAHIENGKLIAIDAGSGDEQK
ncbi:MAG TPA: hypothetical protein VK468_09990, partial [Pyrinomonadaceae bacterium]|nr:hypothetical protein [Pyrinomonadaceae bacterium]